MFATVGSVALVGVEGRPVRVEVHVGAGGPPLHPPSHRLRGCGWPPPGKALAQAGWPVVSGLARGIDGAAQRGRAGDRGTREKRKVPTLLTTERRVAELVAEGLSNKVVAARMFVTVRTVEANLSKVYAKLGVRSRTELVRHLSRQNGA